MDQRTTDLIQILKGGYMDPWTAEDTLGEPWPYIRTKSVFRRSQRPHFKIRTESAVHGFKHPPLKMD